MRSMCLISARGWLISAAVALVATAPRLHADQLPEHPFKVRETIEQRVDVNGAIVYTSHGVRLEAQPIFARNAVNTAEAVSGFNVSIRYDDPKEGDSETWLSHEFIGNIPGKTEELGPFINRVGTGFIVGIHVHSTVTEALLEFQLASDGIVEREPEPKAPSPKASKRAREGPLGFTLMYQSIPLKSLSFAKRVYELYSYVELAIDLVKLATAVVAPEEFVVGLIVGEVEGLVVGLIPESYRGLVGYRCRRCGHQGKLENFIGCKELECRKCHKNRVQLCLRSVSLDVSLDL